MTFGGPERALVNFHVTFGGPERALTNYHVTIGGPERALVNFHVTFGGPERALTNYHVTIGGPERALTNYHVTIGGPERALVNFHVTFVGPEGEGIHIFIEQPDFQRFCLHTNSMKCIKKMDNPVFQGNAVAKSNTISEETKSKSKFRVREKWSRGIEFVLSCIGFAVGLGNIWRFPYLCYKNGGGAFMIPYLICLVAGGIPIFFLEIAIGQYTSQGGITSWNFCPIFKGIGYATTVICFLLNIYYIVILAWTIHFFFNSFRAELPWSSCDNWWNTPSCIVGSAAKALRAEGNFTTGEKRVDAIIEYWERKVLGISSGVDDVSTLQWELVGTLFLAWVLVYFCVWKGVKSSGKVVYFTAIFPYIMLTALLIRGVTLDGALEGIIFYLKPDFSKLLESSVWIDAGTQIFFSYAIALGCMTALGSYNDFHNNFVKDCIFVSVVNSCTSLYSGFAIFSVLGFMSKEHGVPIQEVAESGPGLVFIVYPKAISQMPWGSLWSFLFFFMILLMGIDSQFVGVEGFITAVVDVYPRYLRKGKRREVFIAIVSLISFLIGLTMVTDGGMYMFQIFDYYSASGMVLLWMCFFECITVAYVYGVDKFYDNITEMIGYKLGPWLKICWLVFTPIITMGILLFSMATYKPLTYNRTYVYPVWAQVIGWFMALVPMSIVPIYFFYYLFSMPGNNLKEKWKAAIEPKKQKGTESKKGQEMDSAAIPAITAL